MCAQAWGIGEDGVRLDMESQNEDVAGMKKGCQSAKQESTSREIKVGTKAMTDGTKIVSGANHPSCHRMSRP